MGFQLNDSGKKNNWDDLKRANPKLIKVTIGPRMSIPEIQKIFRFINDYKLNTILVIDGDPWGQIGKQGFIQNYRAWIKHLFNTLQIPNYVITIQLLESTSPSEQIWYEDLFCSIIDMPKDYIHKINQRVKFSNCVLNFYHTGCVTLNDNCVEHSHLVILKMVLSLPGQKFFEIKARIKWISDLYKTIKRLCQIRDYYKKKTFIFLYEEKESSKEDINVLYLSNIILDLIFKDKLLALIKVSSK